MHNTKFDVKSTCIMSRVNGFVSVRNISTLLLVLLECLPHDDTIIFVIW